MPLLYGQQPQKSNAIVCESKDWFKVTIFIPFLDHLYMNLISDSMINLIISLYKKV